MHEMSMDQGVRTGPKLRWRPTTRNAAPARRRVVAALAALSIFPLAPLSAPAQSPWLDGEGIAQALTGHTLAGVYASGRRFSETYLDSGRLEYTEGGVTLHGHWSVTAGTLCTIYDTDPTGGCFRVARAAKNCFEFFFVARTEAQAPGPDGTRPHWTARGALEGAGEACPDEANV